MATIVDVAREAGVSVATVSRVLNGKARVSERLRARVADAVEALQYVPNLTARNLRRNESRTILILAPNITNPYYAHIIAGIGSEAHEQGYGYYLCDTGGERRREQQVLERLGLRQADGAILLATELGAGWLRPYAARYPIVQCSEYDPDVDIAHVSIDNYRATRDVMAYLIKQGHARIGLVSSENRYHSTLTRERAYRDALAEAGISPREGYVRKATKDYSFKSGFYAAQSLLSQEERPTALFCISDMLALGAIASAKEMGFRIPEDVTIIGFDDVDHTTMFHPYVTTVVQPCFQLGRRAMQMLGELMRGEAAPRNVVMPHTLAIRESSGPRHHGFTDFTA